MIGVVDVKEEKIIWSYGRGILDKPHHPTLLDNGNILIFDNGRTREYSRIIELDPVTKEIVWKYQADPRDSFSSYWGGSSQRLPNGNTLITESHRGRVFEVTKNGQKVWEFYNPRTWERENKRGTIYRMMRITDPENYPCLKTLKRKP